MRKRKTKRKLRQKGKTVFRFSVIVILFLLLGISSFYFKTKSELSRPLAYLPVPKIVQVYLPDPLKLPSYITSVLGTQAIDSSDIVKYVNIEREKVSSKPLRISPILMKAAQMRADVILKYQNFSHQDPYENIELVTILPKLNYRFSYASENIGMGGVSAEDFVFGFMHSTSHRENLLSPYLSDTGVAVVTGPYREYYVNIAVQLFAIPGGKKEYLGYSEEEVRKYNKELTSIEAKLNPLIWTVGKLTSSKEYTNEKYKKLTHQKEILKTIYEQMKQEKPLNNNHVALILEYNKDIY